MKKLLVFILAVGMIFGVLTACEEYEIYFAENTSQALTGDGNTEASENDSETKPVDGNEETKDEQTFGGLQELQPLK